MGTGLSASYHILSECPTLQETPQVHLSSSTPILLFEPLGRHHCTRHRHARLNLWPLVTQSAIRHLSPVVMCWTENVSSSRLGLCCERHLPGTEHSGDKSSKNPKLQLRQDTEMKTRYTSPKTSHPSTFRRPPSPNRNGSGKCFWLSPGTLAPPKQLCLFSRKAL